MADKPVVAFDTNAINQLAHGSRIVSQFRGKREIDPSHFAGREVELAFACAMSTDFGRFRSS